MKTAKDFIIVDKDGKYLIEFYDEAGNILNTVFIKDAEHLEQLKADLEDALLTN